jgi:homeobox protein TGIF1
MRDLLRKAVKLKENYFMGKITPECLTISIQKLIKEYLNKERLQKDKIYLYALVVLIDKFVKAVVFENKLIDTVYEEFTLLEREVDALDSTVVRVTSAFLNTSKRVYPGSSSENSYFIDADQKKKKRANFPKKVTRALRAWLKEHKANPYPTELEKMQLSKETGLKKLQISNWFINARRRILPLFTKKYIDCE